jgi:sugar phosphate isomerase/epimerase
VHRRDFLTAVLGSALLHPLNASADVASRICIFTDHLAGFTYQEVARMCAELRVAGPDLTVRRGGLVLPDRVAEDMPRAVQAMREHGISVPMITTEIISAEDPGAKAVLAAASKAGIRYYKLGYFRYADLNRWQETIAATREQLNKLAELNRKLDLRAGLHNHSGDTVGCAVWDGLEAMEGVDRERVGFFYDPSHATIEGGKTGWNLAFRRAASRLMMIAVKDFVWEKTDKGWRTRWVPLGQGMVNWSEFSILLRKAQWPGPLSLHIEYDPGGKTKTEKYDRALEAGSRDLQFLRKLLSAG